MRLSQSSVAVNRDPPANEPMPKWSNAIVNRKSKNRKCHNQLPSTNYHLPTTVYPSPLLHGNPANPVNPVKTPSLCRCVHNSIPLAVNVICRITLCLHFNLKKQLTSSDGCKLLAFCARLAPLCGRDLETGRRPDPHEWRFNCRFTICDCIWGFKD